MADVEEPLPFADETFDAVAAAAVLEHLREPRRVVAEMTRVLRPGGTLAGSVPNAFRLKNRLWFLAGKPVEENPLHPHQFRDRDLRALLDGLAEPRLEYVVGISLYLDLFARRAHVAGLGRALVANMNAGAEAPDRRGVALRQPRPDSLIANVTAVA